MNRKQITARRGLISIAAAQTCEDVEQRPGRWYRERWQPLDTACQVDQWPDLQLPAGSTLRVLLFGDSVDRMTGVDIATGNKSICCTPVHMPSKLTAMAFCDETNPCQEHSSVQLSFAHLNGVWPEGPFLEDPRVPNATGKEVWDRVRAARCELQPHLCAMQQATTALQYAGTVEVHEPT